MIITYRTLKSNQSSSLNIEEIFSLVFNLKELIRTEMFSDDITTRDLIDKLCEKYELFQESYESNLQIHNGKQKRIVFLAKNHNILKEAMELEANEQYAALGRLLGYPECCIKEYIHSKRQNWIYDEVASSLRNTHGSANHLINNITGQKLIFHTPCSYCCEKSIISAKRLIELLNKINPKKTTNMIFDLKGEFIYFCFIDQSGSLKENTIKLISGQDGIVHNIIASDHFDERTETIINGIKEIRIIENIVLIDGKNINETYFSLFNPTFIKFS